MNGANDAHNAAQAAKEINMAFINLTPHTVNLFNSQGEMVLTLPPSGNVARVVENRRRLESDRFTRIYQGIPVDMVEFGEVTGLPEPQGEDIFIVSAMVARAAYLRSDVVSPGPAVRDEQGNIIGARGLTRHA